MKNHIKKITKYGQNVLYSHFLLDTIIPHRLWLTFQSFSLHCTQLNNEQLLWGNLSAFRPEFCSVVTWQKEQNWRNPSSASLALHLLYSLFIWVCCLQTRICGTTRIRDTIWTRRKISNFEPLLISSCKRQ